jgi:hypothetical protein
MGLTVRNERRTAMTTEKKNLPALTEEAPTEVAVFEVPAVFEMLDRGIPTRVSFDTIGETFVGIFESLETALDDNDKEFEVALFTGPDGEPYSIGLSAGLVRPLRKLHPKDWARITLDRFVDTGKPSLMKSYLVQVARTPIAYIDVPF